MNYVKKKKCSICKTSKVIKQFKPRRNNTSYASQCRTCDSIRIAAWRKNNRAYVKASKKAWDARNTRHVANYAKTYWSSRSKLKKSLKKTWDMKYQERKYGLTSADRVEMLKEQGGLCPCCAQPLSLGQAQTDHEHVPGFDRLRPAEKRKYVRGLLHGGCNRMLGLAHDNPDVLRSSADYLERVKRHKSSVHLVTAAQG